jgi:hypothetical protein
VNRPIRTLVCGIFREEFKKLPEDLRTQLQPLFPDSILHMHPEKLDRLVRGFTADEDPCIIVYGDCCPRMRESCAAPTSARTAGHNCCEIMLGSERFRELRKLRTFFFMPEWVERWREIFTDKLGFTDHLLARQFMKETMNQLVYIDTGKIEFPGETIKEIEAFFDMPMLIETPSPRFFEQAIRLALAEVEEHKDKGACQ